MCLHSSPKGQDFAQGDHPIRSMLRQRLPFQVWRIVFKHSSMKSPNWTNCLHLCWRRPHLDYFPFMVSVPIPQPLYSSPPVTTPNDSIQKLHGPTYAVSHPSARLPAK